MGPSPRGKAKVCKTLMREFESFHRPLQKNIKIINMVRNAQEYIDRIISKEKLFTSKGKLFARTRKVFANGQACDIALYSEAGLAGSHRTPF